jgi:hypothetical protein
MHLSTVPAVTSLNLGSNGISTELRRLKFPHLAELHLQDNAISSASDLPACPKLSVLVLDGNQGLVSLRQLTRRAPALRRLSLQGTPFALAPDYRHRVAVIATKALRELDGVGLDPNDNRGWTFLLRRLWPHQAVEARKRRETARLAKERLHSGVAGTTADAGHQK